MNNFQKFVLNGYFSLIRISVELNPEERSEAGKRKRATINRKVANKTYDLIYTYHFMLVNKFLLKCLVRTRNWKMLVRDAIIMCWLSVAV